VHRITQIQRESYFDHITTRIVSTDFGLQNIPDKYKIKRNLISFNSGGDPFPGVYMREIPTLLKEGYRMACPKYVNPKL